MGGGAGGGGGQDQWSEYPDTHKRILQHVSVCPDEDGAHVAAIARAVGGDGDAIM
jgi:hypothetical protein